MVVVLLLALIWAAVLLPPALRAHAERKEAFLVSFGETPSPDPRPPLASRSQRIRCRRRIAGGLLVAMVSTLVVGLLTPFRAFLFVHLFLVDSFLAYVGLLAHMANRAAKDHRPAPGPSPAGVRDRGRRRALARPAVLDLGPIARPAELPAALGT